jgi:hypothetical protein
MSPQHPLESRRLRRTCSLNANESKDSKRGNFTYKRNIEARSRNHRCREKAISVTYSGCVFVALVIQQAISLPNFFTLPHKRHDFLKNIIEYKMCVLIFSTTLSKIFLIVRRSERYILITAHTSSCKVPVILDRF